MLENYKKELREYDYSCIVNRFLKFVLSILLIIYIAVNLLFQSKFVLIISFLGFCSILWLLMNLFLNNLLNKNKINKKKLKFKNKVIKLQEHYENKILQFFLYILKKNHINTKEKIYTLYNEYKKDSKSSIVINGEQSLFVIATTIIALIIQMYNSDTKTIDGNLLLICSLVSIMCIVIYIVYKLYYNLITEIYFNDSNYINEKIRKLLFHYYLHFEKYEF